MLNFIVKYKWYIIAVIIIIVLLVVFSKRGSAQSQMTSPGTPGPSGPYVGPSGPIVGKPRNDNFPLSMGSSGPNVIRLQSFLNGQSGSNLGLDGVWGPNTETAVIDQLASYDANGNIIVTDNILVDRYNPDNIITSGYFSTWIDSVSGAGPGYMTSQQAESAWNA
jgi:hypothetical protein